jgi:hypothetical protein
MEFDFLSNRKKTVARTTISSFYPAQVKILLSILAYLYVFVQWGKGGMKKNNKQDERIKHSRILELQEKESTRQRGDEKFRKMINRFRESLNLEPEYMEEET